MSRNGTGTYNLPVGNPVISGAPIASAWANTTLTDIASALTGSVAADGQTPMTGALDMNSQKVINLAAATVAGNAVEYAQFLAAFVDPTFTGDYLLIPKGTTAERPVSPIDGMIRYNTDFEAFEGYANGAWGNLGGGATGGGGDTVFNLNSMVVTTDYSIPSGKSASSVGPITINGGVVVTIPSGSRWVVL